MHTFRLILTAAVLAAGAALIVGSASGGVADDVFTVHGLVSDTATSASVVDSSLVNGWGLSAGPTTPPREHASSPSSSRSTGVTAFS